MLHSSKSHRCLLCNSPVVMGITLHNFPNYAPYQTQWMSFCRQYIGSRYINLSENVKICSQHFPPSCWTVVSRKVGDFGIGVHKILRNDAVPSIFPESCSSNTSKSKLLTPKISQRGYHKNKNVSPVLMGKHDPENLCKTCIVCDVQRSAEVQLHKIPSKVSIKMAWLEFVEQCLPDFNSMDVTINMIHVCSNHFNDQDYLKDTGGVVPLPGYRQLLPNAVPSIYTANEDNGVNTVRLIDNVSDSKTHTTSTTHSPRQPNIIQKARIKLSSILSVNVAKNLSQNKINTSSDSALKANIQSGKQKEKINLLKPIYPNSPTPYVCPNKRCGEGFLDVNLLREHEKTHFLSDTKYICHICNAVFVSHRSYDNHLTSHFGSKHRFCAQCSDAFTSRTQLLKHISQVHKIQLMLEQRRKKKKERQHFCKSRMKDNDNVKDFVVDIAGEKFEIEIDSSGLYDQDTEGTLIDEFSDADDEIVESTNEEEVESPFGPKMVPEDKEAVAEGVSGDYLMRDNIHENMIAMNEDATGSEEDLNAPYFPPVVEYCNDQDLSEGHMDFDIVNAEESSDTLNQIFLAGHDLSESTEVERFKGQTYQQLRDNGDTIIDCMHIIPNNDLGENVIAQNSSENVYCPIESVPGCQENRETENSQRLVNEIVGPQENVDCPIESVPGCQENRETENSQRSVNEIVGPQESLQISISPLENVTHKSFFEVERKMKRVVPILPENDLPASQQQSPSIPMASPENVSPARRKKRRIDPILSPSGDWPLLVTGKRRRRSTEKAKDNTVKRQDGISCGPVTFDLIGVKQKQMRLRLKAIDSVFPILKWKGFVDLSHLPEEQNYSISSIFRQLIENVCLAQGINEAEESPDFEFAMKDILKEVGPRRKRTISKINRTKLDASSMMQIGKKTLTKNIKSKVRKLVSNSRETTIEMLENTTHQTPPKNQKTNARRHLSATPSKSSNKTLGETNDTEMIEEIPEKSVEAPCEDEAEIEDLAEPMSSTESISRPEAENSTDPAQISQDVFTPASLHDSKTRSTPSEIPPQPPCLFQCFSIIETLQNIRAQTLNQAAETFDCYKKESLNKVKEKIHLDFPINVQGQHTEKPHIYTENITSDVLINSQAEENVTSLGKPLNDNNPDASGNLVRERNEINKSDRNFSKTNEGVVKPIQNTGDSVSGNEKQNRTTDDDDHNVTEGNSRTLTDDALTFKPSALLQEGSSLSSHIHSDVVDRDIDNDRDSVSIHEGNTKANVDCKRTSAELGMEDSHCSKNEDSSRKMEVALVGSSSGEYPVITGWCPSQQTDRDKIPDNSSLTGHDCITGGNAEKKPNSDSCGKTASVMDKRLTANLRKLFRYACAYCGQGFQKGQKKKFDSHKIFHKNTDMTFYTGYYAKQGTCQMCSQCGKIFPSMKLLNQHFISHLTFKSFTCSICYAVFPRSSMVLRHKVDDHGVVKQFICSLCSYCFDSESLLTSHLQNDCQVVKCSTNSTGRSTIPDEEKTYPLIDFHV